MPVIGYNLNIPAANNNPSQDQPKMQTNTNAINTLISNDHFTFADSQAGRHKQVTLTNEAAPGLNGGNGVLFANLATGQSRPFWQNALGSFQIPLIAAQSSTANGYINLSGLIFQWGSVARTGNQTPVTFPIAFPTAVFNIQVTAVTTSSTGDESHSVRNGTVALNGFTINTQSSGNIIRFYWFAIGN